MHKTGTEVLHYEDGSELFLQPLDCSNAPTAHQMQKLETGLEDKVYVLLLRVQR